MGFGVQRLGIEEGLSVVAVRTRDYWYHGLDGNRRFILVKFAEFDEKIWRSNLTAVFEGIPPETESNVDVSSSLASYRGTSLIRNNPPP